MTQDELKQAAAQAALDHILPKLDSDAILGIGTGSTANFFIDLLQKHRSEFDGCVASSEASAERLKSHGIPVYELNSVGELQFYIDGTDESNAQLALIKGGGGALTREKIIASASECYICIADETKWVDTLGRFPLPVEVIPMARSKVARELVKLGGSPILRDSVITDNGNQILDVHDLNITEPKALEQAINHIPGVVTNGLFALRPADILLLSTPQGVKSLYPAASK